MAAMAPHTTRPAGCWRLRQWLALELQQRGGRRAVHRRCAPAQPIPPLSLSKPTAALRHPRHRALGGPRPRTHTWRTRTRHHPTFRTRLRTPPLRRPQAPPPTARCSRRPRCVNQCAHHHPLWPRPHSLRGRGWRRWCRCVARARQRCCESTTVTARTLVMLLTAMAHVALMCMQGKSPSHQRQHIRFNHRNLLNRRKASEGLLILSLNIQHLPHTR